MSFVFPGATKQIKTKSPIRFLQVAPRRPYRRVVIHKLLHRDAITLNEDYFQSIKSPSRKWQKPYVEFWSLCAWIYVLEFVSILRQPVSFYFHTILLHWYTTGWACTEYLFSCSCCRCVGENDALERQPLIDGDTRKPSSQPEPHPAMQVPNQWYCRTVNPVCASFIVRKTV